MEGFQGPYSDRPAFDIVAEAMGGIMHLVGDEDRPPSWTIYGLADVYTGMVTAFGIMQALFARERTGKGQLVDSSMMDNMLALNEAIVPQHSVGGQSPHRGRYKNVWPRGAFKCSDGYIALNVPDKIIWQRLCEAVGRPDLVDDERSNTPFARFDNADYLRPIIEDYLGAMTREEAVDALNAAGVPTGPVNTVEDIFADPHVEARGMLMDIDGYKFCRTTPHLSSNPELPANTAPLLGEHTREILEGLLDYSSDQVDDLAADKVIQVG